MKCPDLHESHITNSHPREGEGGGDQVPKDILLRIA